MKLKRHLTILLFAFFAINMMAKNIVRFPLFESSDTPEFKIDSIAFAIDYTEVFFHYDNREGMADWICISSNSYIKDSKGIVYKLKDCRNISFSPDHTNLNGSKEWRGSLLFQPVNPDKTESIDIIEDDNNIAFNIRGIDITKDGENVGYVNFMEFNRKLNMADFWFSSKKYNKYIELATPLLSQARIGLGKNGVIGIIGKLIDCYVLTNNKGEIYKRYLEEYHTLCAKQGWKSDLTCSMDLSLHISELENKIIEFQNEQKYKDACALMEEYLPKARLIYQETDSILALSTAMYSYMLKQLGELDSAIKKGQEALNEYKRINNKGMVYQTSLYEMACLYEQVGDIENAVKCYRELFSLEDEIGNKYTFKHAQTGYLFGDMCLRYDLYDSGISTLKKSYSLYESSKMKIDSLYLSITEALSQSFYSKEKYDESIDIWDRTTKNIRKRIGTKDSLYLSSIVSYAERCRLCGKIGKATEEIYEVSKQLKSQEVTINQVNGIRVLGNILSDIGDKKTALRIYEQANDLYEKHNMQKSLSYAYNLLDMASTYREMCDTAECIKTCDILIKSVFGNNQEIQFYNQIKISAMFTLSMLYQHSNPVYAASLCKSMVEINDADVALSDNKEFAMNQIKLLHTLHPDNKEVTEIYNYLRSKDKTPEEDMITMATLNLWKFYQGAMSAGDDVEQYGNENKYLIDIPLLRQIFDENRQSLLGNMLFMTEEQRELYYNAAIKARYNPLWLTGISEISGLEELNTIIYDYMLMSKSILLTSSNGIGDIIYKQGNEDLIKKYNTLKETFDKEKTEQIESLEHKIIKEVRNISDFNNELYLNWKDVKSSLKENEVALEFIVEPLNEGKKGYSVLVLRHDMKYPKLFNLSLIEDAIEMFGFERMSNMWSLLMNLDLIKVGDTVYLSAAGVIQIKPFEHLCIYEDKRFSDVCNVVRVSSTREIVKQKKNGSVKYDSAVLFGGLDYEISDSKNNIAKSNHSTTRLFRGEGDDRFRGGFDKLVFSKDEIDSIKILADINHIQYKEYYGKYGTEQAVKEISGHNFKIAHFATHGLYYPESEENSDENPYKSLFNGNSLNRSFLVMSGGNALPKRIEREPENDGLLTAAEIAQIDLHNVELVVLSACRSAHGDLSNEGVMGLQYGFKKAGAKSILMCLDNVDDKATQMFMVEFYRNLLSGNSAHESLKKAQNFMKNNKEPKYHELQYWGNFILLDSLQ